MQLAMYKVAITNYKLYWIKLTLISKKINYGLLVIWSIAALIHWKLYALYDRYKNAITVLGNHDLHLIAAAYGTQFVKPTDTFQDVLQAKERTD